MLRGGCGPADEKEYCVVDVCHWSRKCKVEGNGKRPSGRTGHHDPVSMPVSRQ